jgi:hypothetical protein
LNPDPKRIHTQAAIPKSAPSRNENCNTNIQGEEGNAGEEVGIDIIMREINCNRENSS